jgi:HSP20 family protein
MARALKHDKEEGKVEGGALAPAHSRLPAFAHGLVERMEDLLGERWGPLGSMLRWPEEALRMPAVDVFEESGQVVVKAELPGMTKEEVDVKVDGDLLTISGKKQREEKVERADYFRYERHSGAFTRTIRLPAQVELDQVTAKLEKGVLEIRAPKVTPGKETGRKITVN